MTLHEKVQELVEELIEEQYLDEVDWTHGKTRYAKISVEIGDIAYEIENLALAIQNKIDEDYENAEPQFDTVGEEKGDR